MACLYKRHVTYLLLAIPVAAYLILMVCMLARVYSRSGPDPPETDFRAKYQALVKLLQDHAVSRDLRLDTDTIGADLRKLLELEAKPGGLESSHERELDATLAKLVEGSNENVLQRRRDEPSRLKTGSHNIQDNNVHEWHIDGAGKDYDKPTGFQDLHTSDLRYAGTGYPRYIHNCSTISTMRIRTQLGHGVSKQAFLADYQGTEVVIKMVTRHVHEVKNCLKRLREVKTAMAPREKRMDSNEPDKAPPPTAFFGSTKLDRYSNGTVDIGKILAQGEPGHRTGTEQGGTFTKEQVEITQAERQSCYIPPTARVMKEILLSQQLHHPNLASMLGYCVRSEESDTTDISEHGVISVFEVGSRFVLDNLQILPWPTRLRHATEMASLLQYLEFSPLGSLVVPDFKEGHLIMVNDSLKLIDLDDVNNVEPECGLKNPSDECPYKMRCSRALCEGFNAKQNLKNMNRLVLKRLLFPTTFPGHMIPEIGQLNADLDSLKVTSGELLARLRRIQAMAELQDLT